MIHLVKIDVKNMFFYIHFINFNYFDFPNTNNSINQIGGSNLNAYIDDFRIYETALTKTQIQNNIIGKYIKLHNNTISAISNYGINIENFNNKVNIGNSNNPVDLQIYGTHLLIKYPIIFMLKIKFLKIKNL